MFHVLDAMHSQEEMHPSWGPAVALQKGLRPVM